VIDRLSNAEKKYFKELHKFQSQVSKYNKKIEEVSFGVL
jgi:hypothetical protein